MNNFEIPPWFVYWIGTVTLVWLGKSIFDFLKYNIGDKDRRRSDNGHRDVVIENHKQLIEILQYQTKILEKLIDQSIRMEGESIRYIEWSTKNQIEFSERLKTISERMNTK